MSGAEKTFWKESYVLRQKLGFLTSSGAENREVSVTEKMGCFL
jgi:hypothetical protein